MNSPAWLEVAGVGALSPVGVSGWTNEPRNGCIRLHGGKLSGEDRR
ncbi:MAG: hypothetical protein Q8J74_00070 [Candidatus Didemnitutus sp.]|nr:hypothetical protein [Candidatus Didemnitutus sp.]